jgi:hypothetical protein
MAVAMVSAWLLMGHMKDGEDYSQNGRDINTYEHILDNHGSPSL